jgi:hypothetical protein
LNRPGWITGLAQQLYPDTDAVHGSENGRLDVAHRTERRLPAHPGEFATILPNKMIFNQLGDVSTSSYRDQINVFRKPTIWKQTAGQCGAAEKHNSIREVPAQCSQQMRNQMISTHLRTSNSELFGNGQLFFRSEHGQSPRKILAKAPFRCC